MSIAVLKYFVKTRAEEIASGKLKLRRGRKGAVPPVPAPGGDTAAAAGRQQQQQQQQQSMDGEPEKQQQQPPAAAEQQQQQQAPAEGEVQENPGRAVRILEGLAASGLRSIRYAAEIEGVTEVRCGGDSAASQGGAGPAGLAR